MVGDLRLGVTSGFLYNRDETIELVGSVLHNAGGAVGFLECVGALNRVSVPGFPLVFLVTAERVVHSVLEPVLRVGLEQTRASHQRTAATALQLICNVNPLAYYFL